MDESELLRLSPSRASDFKNCPQLFKFRVIDRLPEPADPALLRGTMVHAVLEELYRLPAPDRTLDRATALLDDVWARLLAEGEAEGIAPTLEETSLWLAESRRLLANHFALEDPAGVDVHELEWWVEHEAARTLLRGIIDRVEVAPDGSWTLTDYKTGRSPSDRSAFGRFFGLRFYALLCWRAFGKMPRELRLMHLGEPVVLTLRPTEAMMLGLERQLEAVAAAILRAHASGDWRPRPGPLCDWCPHRAICPAWAEAESPPLGAVAASAGA